MARKRAQANPSAPKRFSVTVDTSDYERLVEIADEHRPRLTLQYVVQFAIQSFLDDVDSSPETALKMADPRKRKAK